jgi:short-subunit dehydrogenase
MQLQSQKALITGATHGIGSAIANAFMNAGAHVIGAKTSWDEIEGDYCHEWLVANFINNLELKYCSKLVRVHKPEILIDNAGINKIDSFLNISAEDFLNIQQVNLGWMG